MALSGLPPVRAGRFFVYGMHDRGRLPASTVNLRIEAGAAFGTGHHGTTVGCLMAYDRLIKAAEIQQGSRRRRRHGTSGCIAAARTGSKIAVGTDIDKPSVRISKENAKVNRANARFVHASGLSNRLVADNAPTTWCSPTSWPARWSAWPRTSRTPWSGRHGDPVGPAAHPGAHGQGRLRLARLQVVNRIHRDALGPRWCCSGHRRIEGGEHRPSPRFSERDTPLQEQRHDLCRSPRPAA